MTLIIGLALAWGAFSFGAVYPWGYVPIAGVSLGLWGWQWCRHGMRPPRVTAIAVTALAVVVAALVQLIPLPSTTLDGVSPAADRFLSVFDVRYATGSTRHHGLSVVPWQTALTIGALITGIAWVAGIRRTISTRLTAVVRGIAVVGSVLALIGLIQQATFSGKLLWFWTPEASADNAFGPFVNRNHFAGWMSLALAVTAGYFVALVQRNTAGAKPGLRRSLLWFSTPAAQPLLLVSVAMVLMAVSTVWTMSRSGIAASVTSMAVLLVALMRRTNNGWRRSVATGMLTIVLAGAIAWKGGDTVAAWYQNTGTLLFRLDLWKDSLAPLRDFWVLGAGLNTYAALMLVYPLTDATLQPHEAHSDYLQLAIEGGLLLGIPALLLAGAVIRRIAGALRQPQDDTTWWIRMGAVAALCGMAVQEIAEFSLQICGVALLFATCIAIAIHEPAAITRRTRPSSPASVPN